jgi:hypothetical protein
MIYRPEESWEGRVAVFPPGAIVEGLHGTLQQLAAEGATAAWLVGVPLASVSAAGPLCALDTFLTTNILNMPLYLTPGSAPEAEVVLRLLQDGGELVAMTPPQQDGSPAAASGTQQTTIAFTTLSAGTGRTVSEGAAGTGGGDHSGINHKRAETAAVPTLLITATVDTLGAFPLLATGDLSGTAALMELHRRFTAALSAPAGRGSSSPQAAAPLTSASFTENAEFSLQLLVSNSGRLNYGGTKAWMGQRSGEELDTLDFALCIDSLMSDDGINGNKLYLHAAKPFTAGSKGKAVVDLLVAEGRARGLDVQLVTTKLDAARNEVGFEHEILVHKKVPAVTISTLAEPTPQVTRYSQTTRNAPGTAAQRLKLLAERVAWLQAATVGILELDPAMFPTATPTSLHLLEWLEYGYSHSRPYINTTVIDSVSAAFSSQATRKKSSGTGNKASAEDAGGGAGAGMSAVKITASTVTVLTSSGAVSLYPDGLRDATPIMLYLSKSTAFELGISLCIGVYLAAFTLAVGGLDRVRQLVRS